MTRVQFEGGKELQAALAQLPKRVSRSIVNDVLMTAAEPMRKRAASLARREPGPPDLADNIVIVSTRKKLDLPTPTAQAVAFGPAKPFFYGHFVEYGTAHSAAFPFMRPAFDTLAEQTLRQIGERLWTALAGKGLQKPTIDSGLVDDTSFGPSLASALHKGWLKSPKRRRKKT